MSENTLIIVLFSMIILITFLITILFSFKIYQYKKNEEERFSELFRLARIEAYGKGNEHVIEGEKKAYLIIKLREILLRRYLNLVIEFNEGIRQRENTLIDKEKNLSDINKSIYNKLENKRALEEKLSLLNKRIKDIELDIYASEYGMYKPRYDFVTSQKYLDKINDIRWEQKMLISMEKACTCNTDWYVDGSKREGNKIINRNTKMMLLAFNGECDSIISNVTYKNILTMESRLNRVYAKINSLNEPLHSRITERFYKLKLQELHLVYEYQEKMYQEKEEARIIKQQIKEEEKAQKEFERELLRIEKEEKRYKKALEEAKKEVETATKSRIAVLQKRIKELQLKLEEAEENKRAISQAQITKCGYIYIISNIGSFGEGVYKIGMTRRLEPYDRISELNGPSVPYVFDVHAMIFSEHAPNLELTLHQKLAYAKMNRINKRKEFFKISLEEIEKCVLENSKSSTEFIYEHEAKEFRLSEKIRYEEESVGENHQC